MLDDEHQRSFGEPVPARLSFRARPRSDAGTRRHVHRCNTLWKPYTCASPPLCDEQALLPQYAQRAANTVEAHLMLLL